MNGHDFLHLAVQLSNASDEARLRTAVSRAYYGSFHVACDFLHACGVHVPTFEAHARMPQCFMNCGQGIAAEAGKLLAELRGDRNDADYRLEDSRFGNHKNVALRVLVARRITDLLERCDHEPDRSLVRDGLREHARKVLRWQVSD